MCGRFTLTSSPQRLRDRFRLAEAPDVLPPRYNIAPSQEVLVIPNRARRLLRPARWGLIPYWATEPSIGNRMINARAESLTTRNAFRDALRRRRCVVPADGFYEWRRIGRTRQPFLVAAPDGAPMALAGLWDLWQPPDGGRLASFTIITTPANGVVAPIHDRMPAVLDDEALDHWLDPSLDDPAVLEALLAPAADDALTARAVSTWVNSPDHDDPRCLGPADELEAPERQDQPSAQSDNPRNPR